MSNIPQSIDRFDQRDIKITWSDGRQTVFEARALRLECPCAQCVHEITGEKILNPTTVPEDVEPLKINPIGNYAILIEWSDGHSTGIYAFDFLQDISARVGKAISGH